MENLFLDPTIILLIAAFAGFFMAFGIGANDVANAMGTSVGSKAITFKQAIFIAAIFEFLGAYLAGGEVTSTIRKGIVSPDLYVGNENIFIIGMMSALFAAATWLLIASSRGWPVSTTHSIVGSIVGFVIVSMGFAAVSWGKVGTIAASWVVSPAVSGTMAFLIFLSAKKLILDRRDPEQAAVSLIPFYGFFVAVIIGLVTARKGLKHVGLPLTENEVVLVTIGFGVVVTIVTAILLNLNKDKIKEYGVESAFAILMIVTASAMAFAHGSNDVANAIGPLAAINSVIANNGAFEAESALPVWILLLGGFGIVTGLAMWGHRVIRTIGKNITELTPSRGFAAEIAAATTVVIASGTGIPVSTTHTLVGAVLGVGLARGMSALNFGVVGRIFLSWIVTLPAGAILSIVFFFIFKGIFS